MSLENLKPKYNKIVGIDASSQSFAYSVFDQGILIKYGEIDYVGKSAFDRLVYAQERVRKLRSKLKAELYVFESAVYIQNKRTVITLAYFLGAAIGAIVAPGARVEEVVPIVWQKWAGNPPLTKEEKLAIAKLWPQKGKAFLDNKNREERKLRTLNIVKNKYGIKTDSDNIGDAIMIGAWGVNGYG